MRCPCASTKQVEARLFQNHKPSDQRGIGITIITFCSFLSYLLYYDILIQVVGSSIVVRVRGGALFKDKCINASHFVMHEKD